MSRDAKQAYGKATWNPFTLSLLLIKGISLFPPWRTDCVCGAAWTHSIFHAAALCSFSLKTPMWAGTCLIWGLTGTLLRVGGMLTGNWRAFPGLCHVSHTAATCPPPPLTSVFSKQGLMTTAVISNYRKGRISPKGLIFCHDWIKKGGSCWAWKRSLSHISWWRNQRSCHPCQVTELSPLAAVTARRGSAQPPSSAGINCLFNKWC